MNTRSAEGGKMKTYPLESISLREAEEKQFRMVECITHHFTGTESREEIWE